MIHSWGIYPTTTTLEKAIENQKASLGYIKDTHFSSQVFCVHCAYISAAGSSLARKPTRCGGLSRVLMPSCTSPSRPLATFLDSMTLHEEGAVALGADMTMRLVRECQIWRGGL